VGTKYLKEAMANELKQGDLTHHELEGIRTAWLKDLDTLDRLINGHVSVKMTEETEIDQCCYSIQLYGTEQSKQQTRERAIEVILNIIE
jgi:hypothetical protein